MEPDDGREGREAGWFIDAAPMLARLLYKSHAALIFVFCMQYCMQKKCAVKV
jgi:hypothetical protein